MVLLSKSSLWALKYFLNSSSELFNFMHSFISLLNCRQLNITNKPFSCAHLPKAFICSLHLSMAWSLNSRLIWCSAKFLNDNLFSRDISFRRALFPKSRWWCCFSGCRENILSCNENSPLLSVVLIRRLGHTCDLDYLLTNEVTNITRHATLILIDGDGVSGVSAFRRLCKSVYTVHTLL